MSLLSSTRRDFLKILCGTAAVSLADGLSPFWSQAARAAQQASHDRVLVLIQMAGGNDGLNTVIPYQDDAYYRARPGLAIAKNAGLTLNDRISLHPSLTGLRELWDDGRLAIIEGVGYPNPDRSHFRSMDIWHAGDPQQPAPTTGWIGRSLDREQQGHAPREVAAIGLQRAPLACAGDRTIPLCVQRREEFHLLTQPQDRVGISSPHWSAATSTPSGDTLSFLRRSATATLESARKFEHLTARHDGVDYPGSRLGQQLQLVAQMIAADLPTRIYFVSLDGFDTHAHQLAGHAALLRELSEGISAFVNDLTALHCDQRVMISTFSEFGRRVAENGSLGTDHGAASVMFTITPQGQGGLYGSPPGLTDLDDGDLKFTTDFRRVYATLLDDWLEIPSLPVLNQPFDPLGFGTRAPKI